LIDPFNADDIFVGIGDMGMPGVSGSQQAMGVWKSSTRGNSWKLIVGGNDPLVRNAYLPSGAGAGKPGAPAGSPLGRITLGEGNGRPGDEQYLYVMIANPPPGPGAVTPNGEPDFGTFMGLWKTKDGALNWTHVQLQQDISHDNTPNYVPINLFGHDA